jgi:hypothetical protein
MRDLSQYSVAELQSYFSDFHKDYFGFRPRYATPEQWRDREYLEAGINAIHNTMDAKKLTFEGREELRAAGWVVNEDDYNDIIDPLEYAAWSDYLDAEAYGEMQ